MSGQQRQFRHKTTGDRKKPPTLRSPEGGRLNSSKSRTGSRKSPLVLGGEVWVGQVSPQVVEKPIATGSGGIHTFPAEHPHLIEGIDPVARLIATAGIVDNVWPDHWVSLNAIDTRLADRARTPHPDPLAARIDPEIAQRAVSGRVESLPAEEPEISVSVGPGGGTPARTGNIRSGTHTQGAINSGLIDDVCATHPRPLIRFELPQVVQRGWAARGIEIESTDKPEIACGIGPMGAWGPRGMVNSDLSLAETRAAGRFRVRRCPRMHEAAHKLNG